MGWKEKSIGKTPFYSFFRGILLETVRKYWKMMEKLKEKESLFVKELT